VNPIDRQTIAFFPPAAGAFTAVEIGSDLFPGGE